MKARYRHINVDGVEKKAHRVIWERANGPIPPGYEIHHVNFDGHDNRLENLQMLTRKEHLRLHAELRKQGKDKTDKPEILASRERCREYQKNNREKVNASYRKWRTGNEDRLAYERTYREEHREETKAYNKAYNEKHKAELAIQKKTYRDTHKAEKAATDRAYHESHIEEHRAYHKLYYAIRSGKPKEVIDKLQKEFDAIKEKSRR